MICNGLTVGRLIKVIEVDPKATVVKPDGKKCTRCVIVFPSRFLFLFQAPACFLLALLLTHRSSDRDALAQFDAFMVGGAHYFTDALPTVSPTSNPTAPTSRGHWL